LKRLFNVKGFSGIVLYSLGMTETEVLKNVQRLITYVSHHFMNIISSHQNLEVWYDCYN